MKKLLGSARRRSNLEFFSMIKGIIGKHSKIVKIYLATFTVMLVLCITLGLIAYAVPYENSDSNVVKLPENLYADAGENYTQHTAAPTEKPTADNGAVALVPEEDDEITESGSVSGAKSGTTVERNPSVDDDADLPN